MSRPPIRHQAPSPRGLDPATGAGRYWGPRFADLVTLAEAVAREPGDPASSAVELPPKDRGLARTLAEIPALLAHVLGEHQGHYAAEAQVATATLATSLVAHARRLASTPDHGRAATGLAAFTVKPGLAGEVPAGFALQSEPKGEVRAQTYETLEPLAVDAGWNAILPAEARAPTAIAFSGGVARLPLAGRHRLEVGETVLLEGGARGAVCEVASLPGPAEVELRLLSADPGGWPSAGCRVLSRPALRARAFGWDADPLAFPPAALAQPGAYVAPAAVGAASGYVVAGLSAGTYVPGASLILSEAVEAPAPGAPVAVLRASGPAIVARLGQAREAAVAFVSGSRVAIPQPTPAITGFPASQLIERAHAARVTLLDLAPPNGVWNPLPLDALVLADWRDEVAVAPDVPNPAPVTATLRLDADLAAMRPGRRVILRRVADGHAASAQVTRLSPPAEGAAPWEVSLSFEGGAVATDFPLGGTVVLGNCAPVSHGESKAEELGGSDGATPHQAFPLRAAPVTRLPSAEGASPALEVRVAGLLWDRALDFSAAGPDARVYVAEAGADQAVTLRFGGEGRGAVPPEGRRNVTAAYRVGLGRAGDAGAGRLTRVKKSSPILAGVTNPLPLAGGADPASPADLRRQATRPLLTFDRAVSVRDHADLALLVPGIARATARWLGRGVELVAADAAGAPPPDPAALRAFLDARRDAEVPLTILGPEAADVALALRVERDRAHLADAVRLAVLDALIGEDPAAPGLLTFAGRDLSQPQSLSGLYARLLDVPGVAGVEATSFGLRAMRTPGGAPLADIVHATDRQWLRLLPAHLALDVVEPGALTADVVVEATP